MIVFSELEFLQLSESVAATELWETIGKNELHLKYLSLIDSYPLEQVGSVLASFVGLREMVLDYPHQVKTVRSSILHHAESLERLYWRTTPRQRGGVGCLLDSGDLEATQSCTKLRDMAVIISEPGKRAFKLPPNLELLWIIGTEIFRGGLVVNDEAMKRVGDRIKPAARGKAPLKYPVLGSRGSRGFPKQWLFIAEVHGGQLTGPQYLQGKRYTYRIIPQDEIPGLASGITLPQPLEDWTSVKIWKTLEFKRASLFGCG